jgi:hypothetical protein
VAKCSCISVGAGVHTGINLPFPPLLLCSVLLSSAPMPSMLTRMEMRAARCTRRDEMNSGEDERLRGDAITLGVRTSVSCDCDCHVPTYLPYPDGKSSDARGALELLPSGLGRVHSLVHRRTGCIACDKQQACTLLLLLVLLEQEKKKWAPRSFYYYQHATFSQARLTHAA